MRESLAEYDWAKGDSDCYSQSARVDAGLISHEQRQLIDELLQRLTIALSGSASESFEGELNADLSRVAPDPDVRQALMDLANVDLRE